MAGDQARRDNYVAVLLSTACACACAWHCSVTLCACTEGWSVRARLSAARRLACAHACICMRVPPGGGLCQKSGLSATGRQIWAIMRCEGCAQRVRARHALWLHADACAACGVRHAACSMRHAASGCPRGGAMCMHASLAAHVGVPEGPAFAALLLDGAACVCAGAAAAGTRPSPLSVRFFACRSGMAQHGERTSTCTLHARPLACLQRHAYLRHVS